MGCVEKYAVILVGVIFIMLIYNLKNFKTVSKFGNTANVVEVGNAFKKQKAAYSPWLDDPVKVPNIVHFIFGLKPDPIFNFIDYACVKAALQIQKPERVMFHYHYEPQGIFWELIKPNVTLNRVRLVDSIFNNSVIHYAHKADVIRLEVLRNYGGIYLDIDVLMLRSFDAFRTKSFVLGQEGLQHVVGLCNGVIIANNTSLFLERWYYSYKTFNSSQWNYHSVTLPNQLAIRYPSEIETLPYNVFFWPLWDKEGINLMYKSNKYSYVSNYAVHLWHTAALRNGIMNNFSMQTTYENHATIFSHLNQYVPDPFFTIVTPCYNQVGYIKEALLSILQSTFYSWEVIVVDDVSPDQCGDKAELFFKKHKVDRKRYKVIRNIKSEGLAGSRNVAIRQSMGVYIINLDADDRLGSYYLEKVQFAIVKDPTLTLVYADQQFFGISDSTWRPHHENYMSLTVSGPFPVQAVYAKHSWEAAHGYSVIMPHGNEDYDFWMKLIENGLKMEKIYFNSPLLYYRKKKTSMMTDGMKYRVVEHCLMRLRHPTIFHITQLMYDFDCVKNVHDDTIKSIESKLLASNLSDEDKITVHMWLMLFILNKEAQLLDRNLIEKHIQIIQGLKPERFLLRFTWQLKFAHLLYYCKIGDTDKSYALSAQIRKNYPEVYVNHLAQRKLSLCESILK